MIAARARAGGVTALVAIAAGCVGVNPRWDGRDGAATNVETSTDADDASGGSGASTSTSDAMATTVAGGEAGSSSTGEGPTTSDASGAMPCPPDRGLCDGECRKILTDGHHCGEACLDCDDVPGSNGKCQQGVCQMMGEGKAEDG